MLIGLIVACEIGFWVFIAAGLTARYIAGAPRLGAVLLTMVPVVDVVLLAATAVDLERGATADIEHGLAAVYLGFSVAYGHKLVRWADSWAAHWKGGAPRPPKRYGQDYTVECWKDVGRTLAATVIAAAVVGILTLVANPGHAEALSDVLRFMGIVTAIDTVWAASYTFWPRNAPTDSRSRTSV